MNDITEAATRVRQILSFAYGAVLVLIGLDKLFQSNMIVQWTSYVGPLAQQVIPLEPVTFVMVLGAAEIIVGILFFTKWVRLAAWIAIVVLALIIVNLLNIGLYDIAARDALIALGAYSVALIAAAQSYGFAGKRA